MFAGSSLLTAKLLVPAADQSAWLARIQELVNDRVLWEQIRSELARLSPAYGFDVMAEQYLRLLDQRDQPPRNPVRQAIQSGA
jgi:glycosyltransferase involved in cell wall biosynthesis